MVTSRIWAGALACSAALVLTGCVGDDQTTQIRKFLSAESSPIEALPVDVKEVASGAATGRLVGELAGVSYFVTDYVEAESGMPGICLVLTNPPKGSVSGCTTDANASRLWISGSATGIARIVAPDDPVPDGWTKLGGFLIVNPDTTSS